MIRQLSFFSTLGLIGIVLLFLTRIVSPDETPSLYIIIYSIYSLLIVVFCLLAIRIYQFGKFQRNTLLMIVIAATTWIVGDIIVNIYTFIKGEIPFPSIADVFYFAGYILFPVAIAKEIWRNRDILKDLGLKLFFFILPAIFFSVLAIWLWIKFMYDSQANVGQNITSFGYILGDIVLIVASMMILVLTIVYKGGKIVRMWQFLFGQFALLFITDILYISLNSSYESFVWPIRQAIDIMYLSVYFLMGLAFFSLAHSIQEIQSKLQATIQTSDNESKV